MAAGASATEDGLREWVRARTAPFKVPAVIRVIERAEDWPLTRSGKIKKFQLRERLLGERERTAG